MEKKLYWLVENNADLSITCQDIETAMELIKTDFENEDDPDKSEYTLTPVYYTEEEYLELPEAE